MHITSHHIPSHHITSHHTHTHITHTHTHHITPSHTHTHHSHHTTSHTFATLLSAPGHMVFTAQTPQHTTNTQTHTHFITNHLKSPTQSTANPRQITPDHTLHHPEGITLPIWMSLILWFDQSFADGHTASNAPDLFRPPKLSGAGPG